MRRVYEHDLWAFLGWLILLAAGLALLSLVTGCATVRSYDRLGSGVKLELDGVIAQVVNIRLEAWVGASRGEAAALEAPDGFRFPLEGP